MTKELSVQERNEAIFRLFTSKDKKYKETLLNPFKRDGKIHATDGRVLISMPDNGFVYKNEFEAQCPEVKNVIPEPNTRQLIKVDKLDQFKTEEEKEYNDVEEIECGLCNGEGQIDNSEWYKKKYYPVSYECPACKGEGYEQTPTLVGTGKKTYSQVFVKINNGYFDIQKFKKLIQAQEMIGGEIFMIHQGEPAKAHLFEIGEYQILIMPIYYNGDSEVPVIEIETTKEEKK